MNPTQYKPPLYPPHTQPPEVAGRKRTKKDRACDLCRRKKIRCDYDQAYPQHPCASCKSYNKMCTFKEAAKKRGPPKGYVEGLESRLKRMEKLLLNIASNGNLPPETMKAALNGDQPVEESGGDSDSAAEDSHASGSSPANDAQEEESDDRVTHKDEIKAVECVDEERADEPFSYVGSSSGIYLLSRLFPKDGNQLKNDNSDALPRPLEGHEDDLMIARFGSDKLNKLGFGRDCEPHWKLPPKELTDYLVDMYFKRINVVLPILDMDQFYDSYNKKGYADTFIPIILTVCRVTCRLLKKDDPLVKKYKVDRANLFRDIERQMDLYFDLDFLEPKIETIQVLLLSASNAAKWGLESADWISTSIAVKMAQDLGLHRANTQHEGIPKKETEAKKRLWWSAYVIDRVVCASLGRPLTISDADCDVEYPDSEDSNYFLFTNLVKLSCILGDVLRALCSPRARLMSEKGLGLENISRNLEQMLLEWKRSLPPNLTLTDDELSRISRKQIDPALERKLNNGAGRLRLAYCAVFLLSMRPFISMGSGNGSTVTMPEECQKAIRVAVELFEAIETTNLLCGWSLSSYCLGQTQMLLFLNYRNMDANLIAESKSLSERFKNRHLALEDYITEKSLVPFLDVLSKVIGGDLKSDNELLGQFAETSSDEVQQSNAKNDETIIDQQTSLWGASSGIEWQEMVKLLAETGYQI
ncbi:unnamed protein product [Mucor hiemalis]